MDQVHTFHYDDSITGDLGDMKIHSLLTQNTLLESWLIKNNMNSENDKLSKELDMDVERMLDYLSTLNE